LLIVAIRIGNDLRELRVMFSKKMFIIRKIRLVLIVCRQRLIEIGNKWTNRFSNVGRKAVWGILDLRRSSCDKLPDLQRMADPYNVLDVKVGFAKLGSS
jgi:hypothetical protein